MADVREIFRTREGSVIQALDGLYRIHGEQLGKRLREERIPLNFKKILGDARIYDALIARYVCDERTARQGTRVLSYALRGVIEMITKRGVKP